MDESKDELVKLSNELKQLQRESEEIDTVMRKKEVNDEIEDEILLQNLTRMNSFLETETVDDDIRALTEERIAHIKKFRKDIISYDSELKKQFKKISKENIKKQEKIIKKLK